MTVLMQSVKAASPQTAVLSKSADPTQTDAPASQKGEQPGGEISFDLLMALLQATTNVTPQASLQDGSKAFQSTKTAAVKQAAPVNLPGASSKLQSIELPLAANVSQLPRTGLGTQVPDTRNVSQQPRTATASQLPLYMQPEVQASSIWQSQRTGESEPSANSASSEVGSQTGLRLVTQASPTAGDSTQGAVSTTSPAAKTGVPERLIQMLRNAGVPDEDVGAVTTQTSTAQSPPVAYKPLLSVQSLQSDKGDKGKQSIDSANNPLAQKVHEAQSGTGVSRTCERYVTAVSRHAHGRRGECESSGVVCIKYRRQSAVRDTARESRPVHCGTQDVERPGSSAGHGDTDRHRCSASSRYGRTDSGVQCPDGILASDGDGPVDAGSRIGWTASQQRSSERFDWTRRAAKGTRPRG